MQFKRFATIIICAFIGMSVSAQDSLILRPAWEITFKSIFDNSEGDQLYQPSRTHFLGNLDLAAGLKLNRDGNHIIAGGIAATLPYGCEWDSTRISPTLYYAYRKPGVRVDMGMFPRTHLLHELPSFIISDSLRYWQHNIRGAMIAIERESGFFQAYIDWRGLQSSYRREAFCIVANGQFQQPKSVLTLGGTGMLNHLALRKPTPTYEFLVDNLLGEVNIGIDLSGRVSFAEELTANVGPIIALTRLRSNYQWIVSKGVLIDFGYRYRWFGFKNTLTLTGRPLFPFYKAYGYILNEGEPYYASPYYNRSEFTASLIEFNKVLNLTASSVFNFAQNCLQWNQRLILNINIGNI